MIHSFQENNIIMYDIIAAQRKQSYMRTLFNNTVGTVVRGSYHTMIFGIINYCFKFSRVIIKNSQHSSVRQPSYIAAEAGTNRQTLIAEKQTDRLIASDTLFHVCAVLQYSTLLQLTVLRFHCVYLLGFEPIATFALAISGIIDKIKKGQ